MIAFGWGERVAHHFETRPALIPGRVVKAERSAVVVVTPSGEQLIPDPTVAVGDWVGLAPERGPRIEDVMPRWSELTRADPSGAGLQTLAANIDLVLIVAPADRLSAARVERELVVAWDSGAQPVVVLTKVDLADEGEEDDLRARLIGAEVIGTSAVTGDGVEQVAERIRPDRTAVLLGPSGAGKSTLVNALLGEDVMKIGAVRDEDRRGRHTTTSRHLLPVPGGGVIIDTPGLRSLGLGVDGGGVAATFPDIEELAALCRFADCRHDNEPGCAVVMTADPARLASFRKLQREAAYQERRDDYWARRDEVRKWKAITKSNRRRVLP